MKGQLEPLHKSALQEETIKVEPENPTRPSAAGVGLRLLFNHFVEFVFISTLKSHDYKGEELCRSYMPEDESCSGCTRIILLILY